METREEVADTNQRWYPPPHIPLELIKAHAIMDHFHDVCDELGEKLRNAVDTLVPNSLPSQPRTDKPERLQDPMSPLMPRLPRKKARGKRKGGP